MCKHSHVQEQFFFHSLDLPPFAEDMQLQQQFRGGGGGVTKPISSVPLFS